MSTTMWGWLVYLLGAAGVLFVLWWLTRPFYLWVKVPLRMIAAAVLLTPWSVSAEHGELAPAWVITLFDGFAQQDVGWQRAGGPLLAMLMVAILVAGFEVWRRHRKGLTAND